MDDDRILCADCTRYRGERCTVADSRKLVGVWGFIADLVHLPTRCIFFAPLAEAQDQRSGADRFPWLATEYRAIRDERNRVMKAITARGVAQAKAALA